MNGHRPDRCTADHQSGFTLVEMLVVVGVLGLLVLVAHQSIQSGSLLWFQAQQRTSSLSDTSSALEVIRRMLEGASPTFAREDLADSTVAFAGGEHHLALVSSLPDAIAGGVLANQRLFVGPENAPASLMLGWQLRQPSAATGDTLAEQTVPLLRGIRAVQFAYYGALNERDDPVWMNSWQDQARLPRLIRVRLEPIARTGAAWPDLVVAPRATTSPSCIYDVSSVSCRRVP